MGEKRDLLVEIGTEELPPKSLADLSDAFAGNMRAQLDQNGLRDDCAIEQFSTPRRLALLIRDLDESQPDTELVRRGPSLRAAFDDQGRPTKAALGFARSCGVDLEELTTEETPKG